MQAIAQENAFIDIPDWLTQLDISYGRFRKAGWDFLLVLRAGVDQFGRTDHAKAELYELASQQTGLAVSTLITYVSTVRSPISPVAIELGLTFSHARAALGMEPEAANDLLTKAAENSWTPERVSQEAWISKASVRKSRTPNGDGEASNHATDEPPYNDNSQYTDEWTAPALPDDVVTLAYAIKTKYSATAIRALVAELTRDLY